MTPSEKSYLNYFNGAELKLIGYFILISILSVNENFLEIAWYFYERFHEVYIKLPTKEIVRRVSVGKKPCLFVKDEWIFLPSFTWMNFFSIQSN
jgi:hypothetical protein